MGRRDPDQSIGRQLLVLAIKHTDTRRVRIRQSAASHGTHYTHTVHIVARKKSKTNARRWKLAPAKSTRRDTTTTKKRDGPLSALIFRQKRNQLAEKEELDPLFLFDSPVLLETLVVVVGRRWQRKRCRRHPLLRIVIIHAFQLCVYIHLTGAALLEILCCCILDGLIHHFSLTPGCCLEYYMHTCTVVVRVMNVVIVNCKLCTRCLTHTHLFTSCKIWKPISLRHFFIISFTFLLF